VRHYAILALLSVMLSLPAGAAVINWKEGTALGTLVDAPTTSVGGVGTVQQARNGGFYTYTPTTANITSDSSAVIDVRVCGGPGPTVIHYPDVTDGSNYTAEGFVYGCPTSTFSVNTCHKILADIDGGGVDNVALDGDAGDDRDGSLTSEQRMWITAIRFPFIAFHHTVNVSGGGIAADVRVDLFCAHP
jgi:hypothetical protein